ncbi:MAG: hypothetical protein KGL43_04035 [Burkholderiales bacterium]|nr:hypothetical protein [Burkholderiales bacterium]
MSLEKILIADARHVARRAWSFRLALLSALFSGLQFAVPFMGDLLPPRVLVVLALVSGVGSAVARVVPQPRMHHRG